MADGIGLMGHGTRQPLTLSHRQPATQPAFFSYTQRETAMATMAITADMVKKLRDQTGAGMMECKNALTESNGDFDEATTILRKRGLASAAKKAGRTASEGLIANTVAADHSSGILAEVNCESDFVARTPDFQQLMQSVLDEIARAGDAANDAWRKDQDGPIASLLTPLIENLCGNLAV